MSQAGILNNAVFPWGVAIRTLTGNSGGVVAADGSDNINIVGTGGIVVTGTPLTNTLTISGSVGVVSLAGTTGGPLTGALLLSGGTGITTAGSGTTITITMASASTTVVGGISIATDAEVGTGVVADEAVVPSSLAYKLGAQTLHGLALGAGTTGTTVLAWTAEGATGQTLMGTTGNNPGWTGSPTFSGTATGTTGLSTVNGPLTVANTDVYPASAIMQFYKTNGAGATITGDILGQLKWLGNDGTGSLLTSLIDSYASGTIASGRIGSNLRFSTHPDSVAANPTLRMTIASTGEITISAPDSGVGLTVSGGGLTVTAGTTTLTPIATATYSGLATVSTTGALGSLVNSHTDGQVLIAAAAGTIAWATLGSTGSTIVYTPGTNALNLEVATATTTQRGGVVLATNAETRTGTDTNKAVTPDDLSYKLGTQTVHGLAIGGGASTSLGWLSAGTANQFVISGGASADPTWSTYTMPTTPVQGDIFYASSATVISQLAKDANATRYLSNTGTTNNPAWAQIALGTGVSGTLPIANGGTNSTSYNNNGAVYFNGTSLVNDTTTTISSGTVQTTTFRTGTSDYLSIAGTTVSALGASAAVPIALTTKGTGNINLTTAGTAYDNGLVVLRCIPSGGWSNSEWRTGQAAVQTTNATPTAILTIPLVASLMVSVKILINGFQDDYTDCVGGEILVTAYRAATGDIKLVGAPIINVNYTDTIDTSDIDASIDVPSQSLLLKVIGVAAQNWNWVATFTYMYTISNA